MAAGYRLFQVTPTVVEATSGWPVFRPMAIEEPILAAWARAGSGANKVQTSACLR
jgi:hypothetical protein